MTSDLTTHPSQSGAVVPAEMPEALAEQRLKERQFLEQLLDTSKIDNYTVPVVIKADLRKYQQVLAGSRGHCDVFSDCIVF